MTSTMLRPESTNGKYASWLGGGSEWKDDGTIIGLLNKLYPENLLKKLGSSNKKFWDHQILLGTNWEFLERVTALACTSSM